MLNGYDFDAAFAAVLNEVRPKINAINAGKSVKDFNEKKLSDIIKKAQKLDVKYIESTLTADIPYDDEDALDIILDAIVPANAKGEEELFYVELIEYVLEAHEGYLESIGLLEWQ